MSGGYDGHGNPIINYKDNYESMLEMSKDEMIEKLIKACWQILTKVQGKNTVASQIIRDAKVEYELRSFIAQYLT